MKHIFNSAIFFIATSLYSADPTCLRESFKNLPSDIQWLIGRHLVDEVYKSSIKTYPIEQRGQDQETLLIPTYLRSIELVKGNIIGEPLDDLTAVPGEDALPDEQCWHSPEKRGHLGRIRLDKDSQNTDDRYKVKSLNSGMYFDGINDKGFAVYACSSAGKYLVYLLKQSGIYTGTKKHKDVIGCFFSGHLQSIMLHSECNRLVLSRIYDKKCLVKILDIVVNEGEVCELVEDADLFGARQKVVKSVLVAQEQIETPIKKIMYLGSNRYLALNDQGALFKLELIKNTEQKHKIIVHPQIHLHIIKDMAVDRTRKTADGAMPHIAFMNTVGEIFITDMRLFKKPTMVLVHTIKDPDNVALYYHDKKLGLMYSAENDVRKKFEVFSDCYELLYLKALLAMR